MNLRKLHRTSAIIVGLFVTLHLANHFAGTWGQESHIAFMAEARKIYRHPLIEAILIVAVLWQAVSGMLLAKGWGWAGLRNAQVLSGVYLAVFLCIHVSAIFIGRNVLQLDTDFRFGAAGFHAGHWIWFFAPYYFLAVFSVFTHVAYAIGGNAKRPLMVFGFLGAGLIVAMLAGWLYQVQIPTNYLEIYG